MLTSAHLVQFTTNRPAVAALPFERRDATTRVIAAATAAQLSADRPAKLHFDDVFGALAVDWAVTSVDEASSYAHVDTRLGKLQAQGFVADASLVVFGAGGTYPCAGRFDVTAANADQLIVDQTLYWLLVPNADEADFIVGC